MTTLKKINREKKGDMNFWMVLLILALIFMVIIFFVMTSVFQYWGKTTKSIETKISQEAGNKENSEQITAEKTDGLDVFHSQWQV